MIGVVIRVNNPVQHILFCCGVYRWVGLGRMGGASLGYIELGPRGWGLGLAVGYIELGPRGWGLGLAVGYIERT